MRLEWTIIAAFLLFLACGRGGDTREWSTGKGADGTISGSTSGGTTAATTGAATADATTGGTGGGTTGGAGGGTTAGTTGTGGSTGTTNPVGGDNGATSSPTGTNLALAKTLEQCEAQGKAWIAVVNGGASPAACGEDLDAWCCTEPEIAARFPSMAGAIQQRIDQNKADSYKLYHCSRDPAGKKFTFHMAQIGNNFVKYKTIFVSDVIATDTGNNGRTNCPVVTTANLKVDITDPNAGTSTGATLK